MNRNYTSIDAKASPLRRSNGIGDVASSLLSAGATLTNVAATSGMTVGASAGSAAAGAAAGAASLAAMGITAGLAVAGIGINAWIQSARLRGQQKIGATNIANLVEQKLKNLKDAYEASGKTFEDWQYAKQTQDQLLDYLQGPNGCGNPELGSAGQRCISERICESGCAYPWLAWYDLGPAPQKRAQVGADGNASLANGGSLIGSGATVNLPIVGEMPILLVAGLALMALAFLIPDEKASRRGGN